MALYETISETINTSLKAGEKEKVTTLRTLKNSVDMAVKGGETLGDELVLATVQKEIKRRREAILLYEQGGAPERAAAEQAEIDILAAYQPDQMSEEEVTAEIEKAISETGAAGPNDLGKVMANLKDKLANKADMAQVSKIVREKLTA